MKNHPIATPEQHEHELEALALIEHPVVKEAYARVKADWREKANPSPAMLECFDWAFHEVMFSAAVWSSNQDPLRPKVVTISRLAHPVGDVSVPGSRWGIDNPDSIYRVIPISGDEEYRIHGRVGENRMTENYFTLWDENMNTVDVLSGHDLVVNEDRTFTISVDAQPGNGRPNHVQSAPEAHEFYIRDVMLDWSRDEPNELRVERLGDAPSSPPKTLDEQAQLTAKFMAHYADFTHRLSQGSLHGKPNRFSLGWSADTGGALRKQVYVGGHFRLEEDEAFVIHVSDGGAAYFVVPIANIWGTTLKIVDRTSSLNKAQSMANADGTYTYVLSRNDPGVHNWLDPCDMDEGMLTLRMAEFPEGGPREDLSARGEVLKLADLPSQLPEGTVFVGSGERSEQQAQRAAGYKRRLPEA
ncbi:MAG TPA: hypothetical protein EYQ66_08455 [Myxococcales bacterium]|nr:hypothetical protein [Myxococcales bacterium]